MRGLAVCAFAAIVASPLAVCAQGFALDATPTPAPGTTPTPTPAPSATPEVVEIPWGEDGVPATPGATPVAFVPDATPAPAPTPKPPRIAQPYDPGLPGQLAYPGALRVVAASPGDPGASQFAVGLEWFSEPGFIAEGKNHRRTLNTIAVDHTLSRYFAVSAVMLNMANHSAVTNPLYIAALGDMDLSARISAPLYETNAMRLSGGVRAGVKLMQGDGAGKAIGDAASPYGRALVTLDTPVVRLSADGGYLVDRSAGLVPDGIEADAGQLYAYGVSDYNAILAGVSADVPAWRVSPFTEVTTRIDLGAEGEPATLFTAGLKMATADRRMSVLAGFDYGLSGKKLEEGRLRVPTWNVIGGVSYAFGQPRGPRPSRTRVILAKNDPGDGAIALDATTGLVEGTGGLRGRVIGLSTRAGIARATVSVEGGPRIETDDLGTFELKDLKVGTARLVVKAAGFVEKRQNTFVTDRKISDITLYLSSVPVAAPVLQAAALKGKVISTKGKPIVATITATSGGKTREVKSDAKGVYRLDLVEGAYELTITATGMKKQTHTGTLKPQETFEVDFMLAPEKKKKTAPAPAPKATPKPKKTATKAK